ncbi:PleD family two-component system response regulator [Candidatus Omnitrophota bacterium]
MKKIRVLIVDDEADFLKILRLNLEQEEKYEIITYTSAVDIVSKVHDFKPDVILLDLLMPVVSGLDACLQLNKDPVGQKIPIIILSALDKDKDQLKAYKVGVVDYLVKPIEKNDLIARIDKALKFK